MSKCKAVLDSGKITSIQVQAKVQPVTFPATSGSKDSADPKPNQVSAAQQPK